MVPQRACTVWAFRPLKNRLGLRDQTALQTFELEMSNLRAEEPLPPGCVSVSAIASGHIARSTRFSSLVLRLPFH
jgi:hypothetical protein